MKLIKPSVEIWEQGNTLEDMWKHIARCTRVCYQSTPKENGESDEEFVKRVILRTNSSTGRLNFDKIHGGVLEHGTIYLKLEFVGNQNDKSYLDKYKDNKYSRYYKSFKPYNSLNCTYVTTNFRVLLENDWLDDLYFICEPTEFHHRRVTVSFITNIGVSREFNRHRVNSMAEESTRYCNYNKRNDGQLNIGVPAWLLDDEHFPYLDSCQHDVLSSYCQEYLNNDIGVWCDMDFYLFSLSVSEYCYNMLIEKGWTPQQAREVLPLATKTQLIHTAFVDDWKHFFALRADGVSGPPHPNAKAVAAPLKEEFIKRGYI